MDPLLNIATRGCIDYRAIRPFSTLFHIFFPTKRSFSFKYKTKHLLMSHAPFELKLISLELLHQKKESFPEF